MKKGIKIALIVAAVMLIIGSALLHLARGQGESLANVFRYGFSINGNVGSVDLGVDQKGYTVLRSGEESFDAAKVKSLDVDWISGAVKVEAYDGKSLTLKEESSRKLSEDECLRWKLTDGKLSVLACANGVRNLPEKTLTVRVPRAWSGEALSVDTTSAEATVRELELSGTMSLESTSGDLSVTGCACAELRLNSTSGDQRAETTAVSGLLTLESTSGIQRVICCTCAELRLDSTSGDQHAETTAVSGEAWVHSTSGSRDLRALSAKEISIDTTSGDTIFDGAAESLRAESTSGKVDLYFSEPPAEMSVDTNSGDVTISFPKGTEIDLHQDTNSGKVSIEGHVTYLGIPVTVETTSGNITIREH